MFQGLMFNDKKEHKKYDFMDLYQIYGFHARNCTWGEWYVSPILWEK